MSKITKEKIHQILSAVEGLNAFEWGMMKVFIDKELAKKAAKVQLDGTEELQRALEIEFQLRRYSE